MNKHQADLDTRPKDYRDLPAHMYIPIRLDYRTLSKRVHLCRLHGYYWAEPFWKFSRGWMFSPCPDCRIKPVEHKRFVRNSTRQKRKERRYTR